MKKMMKRYNLQLCLLAAILPVLSLPASANTLCWHQDGRWEHRVDEDGNMDIAVTATTGNGHIYIGGSPGRLQMIKVDEVGGDIRLSPVKDQPGLQMAAVSLGSDISAPAVTLAFYDPASGGTLVLPVPNLVAVLLRSHTLTLTIPHQKGDPQTLSVDVSDIPTGTGHRCGREEDAGSEPAVTGDTPSGSTLPLQLGQTTPSAPVKRPAPAKRIPRP